MALKADIYTLVKQLIGSEVLIFANQNAERPVLPYWTINISTRRSIGDDGFSQGVTDDGDQKVTGVREATVQIQRFGVDSINYCEDLVDNLSKQTLNDAWIAKKIAVFDIGDVQNVPILRDDSNFEQQASVDIFIRYGTELLDRVGVIEQVDTAAEYVTSQEKNLIDTNADLAQTISVVL